MNEDPRYMTYFDAVYVLAFLIMAIRFWMVMAVPPEAITLIDIYKDLAHVFVGAMGGIWLMCEESPSIRNACRLIFITLCVVEVFCATISRLG